MQTCDSCHYDQVKSLSSRGLSVAAVNSNTTPGVKAGVIKGEYGLVFFSPELLLEKKWRELFHTKLYMNRVRAFIVDEAHTVKKW